MKRLKIIQFSLALLLISSNQAFTEGEIQTQAPILKEEPVVIFKNLAEPESGQSPASVREAFENFLEEFPEIFSTSVLEYKTEYEALSQTIYSWMESRQFNRMMMDPQCAKEPFKLSYVMPNSSQESNSIQDTSKSWDRALQSEPADRAAGITISLVNPARVYVIEVKWDEKRVAYLINPQTGSILSRITGGPKKKINLPAICAH